MACNLLSNRQTPQSGVRGPSSGSNGVWLLEKDDHDPRFTEVEGPLL